MSILNQGRWALIASLTAGMLALSACSAGSLGTSSGSPGTGNAANVEITVLADSSDQTSKPLQAAIDAFNATDAGVTVKLETRAQGTDGDNIVKTRLATGEMTDIFQYNSGSLLAALDPAKNLVPLTGEPFMANVDDSFKTSVTQGGEIYGAPQGSATGGGILYNKKVFTDLNLQIPKTWAEFMANNAKIKAAGIDPVIQTYGETWTSQLFVLADFHNVTAAQSDWAEQYTANQAHYAEEPALKGFQRLEEVYKAGYLNKDFASAKQSQGLQKLVEGSGAQYPMLTFVISAYVGMADDAAENIGFFAQPGDDAATYGLTAWSPGGLYIPTTTTGDKLEAAKKFLAFWASPAGCDAQTAAVTPTGPYMVKGCTLPEGLPTAVNDLQQYFTDGNASPALEFVSPLKGPNLEKITVEVGSGISSAADGAKRYDEDVKKQAQQLGLPGW
ncbi:MAG: extracellular solute-binding protein [Propionicimonas sp.]|uniref:ABC transporter substrate-binding protein n=1 Tax=Propionicimonas sp. TaxID=1955623 RepID=UPI002B2169D4|nr:extracellular solute-binding protein [Propionicimonas sp.]MEA4945520.1 extracellular solute-binding protein [Propionicimonas sp.]